MLAGLTHHFVCYTYILLCLCLFIDLRFYLCYRGCWEKEATMYTSAAVSDVSDGFQCVVPLANDRTAT